MEFKEQIQQGIPKKLPRKKEQNLHLPHAPKRKDLLSVSEKPNPDFFTIPGSGYQVPGKTHIQ